MSPKFVQVVVSDGKVCRLAHRPIVHVVREQYIKTNHDGSTENVVIARPVPALLPREVEHLTTSGLSTIMAAS